MPKLDLSCVLEKGNALDVLKKYPDNYFDSVVTDSPYGLGQEPDAIEVLRDWIEKGYHEIKSKRGFMGKEWDSFVPQPNLWKEVFRVLKPGGYLLSFFGTRTHDWGVMAIRLAGFEIRDMIAWIYATGFPKNHNIENALQNKICKCGTKSETKQRMCSLSNSYLSETIPNKASKSNILQPELQKQNLSKRGCKMSEPGIENGTKPRMERGDNNVQEKRQLQKCNLCEMPSGICFNGEKGRLHNGAQAENCSEDREAINEDRGGTSFRSQSKQQQHRKFSTISYKRSSQNNGGRENCDVCGKFISSKTAKGWGTATKPAIEPICVARKPLDGTVVENFLKWGTGGLNIDGCRIEYSDNEPDKRIGTDALSGKSANQFFGLKNEKDLIMYNDARYPANVILDPVTADLMDMQTGVLKSGSGTLTRRSDNSIFGKSNVTSIEGYGDQGGGSRFFYVAKTSKFERNAGCENLIAKATNDGRKTDIDNAYQRGVTERNNDHPTVKPIALMRYLLRLVTPVGGTSLDLFAGSGTTACAAAFEGFNIVLIEMTASYWPIIEARTKYWQNVANRERYIEDLKNSQTKLF